MTPQDQNGVSLGPKPSPKPKTVITVVVLANGDITWRVEGEVNVYIVNGCMETARQEIVAKVAAEVRKQPGIAAAPPGFLKSIGG